MEEASTSSEQMSTAVSKNVDPVVDLGNLLIEDQDPITKSQKQAVKDLVRDNAQYLINEIWKLPTERVEDAIIAKFPAPTSRLPREKPIPKPKAPTRWQQYAQTKGIRPQRKTKKVWDDVSQSWKPRWGYNRANDNTKDWLVEIPDHQDPYKDFYAERNEAKQERTGKNELQRLRNVARSKPQKLDGLPTGVGMNTDSKSSQQISRQISQAKTATASVGKFQQTLANERAPKNRGKKRQFAPNEVSATTEKEKQLDILKRLGSKKPKLNVEAAVGQQQSNEESNNKTNDKKKPKGRGKSSVHKQQFFQAGQKQKKQKGRKT